MFFLVCFFLYSPLTHSPRGWNVLESERPLCSLHHIGWWRNTKICIHIWSENMINIENRKFLKGNCEFFLRYLSEMKIISMFYNFFLFWYFLQLLSIIFFTGDIQIKVWQVFRQTFCFHFQIRMIWTALITMNRGLSTIVRSIIESS